MKIKLPPHVHGYKNRHKKLVYYVRRDGKNVNWGTNKKKALPGLPWSPEFMAAHEAAMSGYTVPPRPRGTHGSIDALVSGYFKHKAFTEGLALATQNMRRPILEHFRTDHGDKRAAALQRQHVIKIIEGKTRNAQKNWLKAFRGLMAFAIMQEVRADDPSQGLKAVKGPKSKGHMTWLEPQVTQYREHHKIGTVARLALELLLNIAARRHDAHALGRQHIKNGKIEWRPHKTLRTTAKLLKVKIIPQFQAALDAMPETTTVLTFLTNDYGRPFASAAAFGNKFADWCRAAELKPVLCEDGKVRNYRAHGLRKAALRALAHSGCTGSEMMQVGGHSSLAQLQEYLDEVEQERQADAAMAKLVASATKTETA